MAIDFTAYVNANPDLVQSAADQGMDPAAFGQLHYDLWGKDEPWRVVPQSEQNFAVDPGPVAQPSFASALPPSVVPLMDNMDWSAYTAASPDLVEAAQREGRDPAEFGRAHYENYGFNESRAMPSFRVNPTSQVPAYPTPHATYPDYGVENVFGARTAQLMPANAQFATPYYSAYNNAGDFAAAVGTDPDQRVRLVNQKTGEVYFEGTGPDAARMAATQANVRSQDLGKGAEWKIEVAKPGEDWQQAGYENVDKKKGGFLGMLMDIGLPILANMILPGSGFLATAAAAAAGSGVSSALQGRPLGDSLLRAGLTGLTAGTLNGALTAGKGATSGLNVLSTTPQNITSGIGNIIPGQQIVDNFFNGFIPTAAGNSVAPLVVNAAGGAGANLLQQGLVGGLSGLTGAGAGNLVDPLVVRPTQPSTTNLTPGVPIPPLSPSPAPNIPSTPPTGTGVDGITVVAPPLPPPGPPVDPTPPFIPPLFPPQAPNVPTDTGGGGVDIKTILSLLPALGALGAGNTGGGGGYGDRGSLSPIFSASLPNSSTVKPFTARNMNLPLDYWKRYAVKHPERSFFEEILDRGPAEYAKGGATFSVHGPGTGRSDDIPALLSDGEYVIDAETVALLGDGSSRAGAKRLDDFRVNVRKHKGSKLAEGEFSAKAKEPARYMSGGRT